MKIESFKLFSNLHSFGVSQIRRNILQKLYKTELSQALVKVETPFDLYIEMVNLVSRIPGMGGLNIDRNKGVVITWNEINQVWKEGVKTITKIPAWAVSILRKPK